MQGTSDNFERKGKSQDTSRKKKNLHAEMMKQHIRGVNFDQTRTTRRWWDDCDASGAPRWKNPRDHMKGGDKNEGDKTTLTTRSGQVYLARSCLRTRTGEAARLHLVG